MSEPTNADRAERAFRVVDSYRKKHDPEEDNETVLSDLLADLLHFCDERNLDFAKIEDTARMHYEAELDEAKG